MKQNQFIQSCMQNYMKNCQHYLTGEKKLLSYEQNILGNAIHMLFISSRHEQYKPNVVLYHMLAVYLTSRL